MLLTLRINACPAGSRIALLYHGICTSVRSYRSYHIGYQVPGSLNGQPKLFTHRHPPGMYLLLLYVRVQSTGMHVLL